MAGRQKEDIVIQHTDIVDVEVELLETKINFVVQPKTKPKSAEEEKEEENESSNKNNNKWELPKYLQGSSKYIFSDQSVLLKFWDKKFDYSLVSISGIYVFNKSRIQESKFEEITEKAYLYNMNPAGKGKTFRLNLRNCDINRHIYGKTFHIDVAYLFLDDVDNQLYHTRYQFDAPYFQIETRMQFKFLGHFHADKSIVKLYNVDFKMHQDLSAADCNLLREIDQHYRKNRSLSSSTQSSSNENFIQMLKYALNIEDLASQNAMKQYAMRDVTLHGIMDRYTFRVDKKNLPPNFDEMSLCLVPMDKFNDKFNDEDDCIFTQIEKIENGLLHFEKKFPPIARHVLGLLQRRCISLDKKYFVRFVPNRITYRACFQALDSIPQYLLNNYFTDFEYEPVNGRRSLRKPITDFEWYNKQIATNQEQMDAIKNIVNRTAFPFPFVIFGPPGTGKTSCLVECVAQILKINPASHIMITAQSNSACDEIGVRLLKYVSQNQIYRFYSPSLLNPDNGETNPVLRSTSNIRGKRNQYPTREEFNHFNVTIFTLMTASRIIQMNVSNRHFDYIFIDESAAATEPECLVPIMGLGADFQEITTQIVLLGDHKQLGPVIESDFASKLGLGESLMERLMKKRRYQPSPEYNKNYVTQLLDNYRSHPAILQFSNVQFYGSMLRAKISEPAKSFAVKWMYLSNKKFPVLFHSIKTPSQIQKRGTSSFNDGEIEKVRFYVDLLLKCGIDGNEVKDTDIGIVSPYKAQLSKLREALQHVKNIEIGTAEYYQGREKKIIIISTVKSKDHIGFLKSEKRLNVCITRAKSLLILVGNPETLQRNDLWNSFIHFCKANGAFCGENFALKKLTDDEEKLMDEMNSYVSQLGAVDQSNLTLPDIDKNEQLRILEERMAKLELLKQKL